ncbi:MAG: UDP-N-acetylmuramoyl-tripeptide--D-alanyl-D-alanine ligase [Bacteroidetes bacterium MedPE-SWsnd-G2]|nr:MAG: UDP-N-acetylmuramoyl-tripeptide--D-alanyl-D-alanine ligase [Bacteroidetes bacterium MedPE-SWsnd-G2]
MDIKQLHQLFLQSSGVSTDTRKIKNNSIFFALKGENFNGNTFASKAISLGAQYAIIDESEHKESDYHILVENVLETLQNLASFHRDYLNIPIVALTGSNGKTTTKELINAVLSTTYKTTATIGNLNNHIGVPLTLLSMDNYTEIGIVEMGANHHKEIALLSSIAKPDIGVITNFGKAHLEGFGSLEGVVKAKSELYDYLKSDNKTILVNSEDPKQIELTKDYAKTINFGSEVNTSYYTTFKSANPLVEIDFNHLIVKSQLTGSYNYTNIAIATAMGLYFKINPDDIKSGIEHYLPTNNRSQIIKKGANTILLDAYNANPSSMMAALQNLKQIQAKQKTIVLGDMFELGNDSKIEHEGIVNYIEAEFPDSTTYLVGAHFHNVKTKSKHIKQYKTFEDFLSHFKTISVEDNFILIKGSRGMALERLLDTL